MSGTKGELAESLGRAIEQPSVLKEPFHVLAIDVGLRNFSFSRFRLDRLDESSVPSLLQWYKMDLHQYTGIENEEFTPVNYSQIMGHVVRDLVYAGDVPDVVVVERQRFRTMGNKNVFEHILKSNILESILVATILAKGSCRVESQSPQKMASYWTSGKDSKTERMAKVARVLRTGPAAKTARRTVPVAPPLRPDGVSQLYQFCLQDRRGRVAQEGRRRGRLAAARAVLPRL
ncbi:hypothetical protein KL928_005208 [Ogataea angusta]|uniref:Mitochondrial resolvase Ydc2 catalytic domain-containing protein n=1 Tax=Pichia angusta TaxID=870730 RepID=A0AAN6DAI6_PICAN|nr:uncharacterized protein KL928_005208 [Ogataea angusta]KAG7815869.1 hypothetical protein KL928_005208 [Ogataea angusta]KAG7832535.1 hypothetical protein KL943_004872 [Ogataea angusta]